MIQIPEEQAKERIAKRIAQEFKSEDQVLFINTGIGIPTMVPGYIKEDNLVVQAENGILGVGPLAEGDQIDPQLINAGRQPVMQTVGCSFFDSTTSFGMIRGGHIDATILGAFEVDQQGNIANWIIPNGKQLGVGGAMDLVTGAERVIIAMTHTNKKGKPKVVKECTLPVTGYGEVDMLVTEYAAFVFKNGKMILTDIAPEITLEELKSVTEAEFEVSPDLKVMDC
jgi:3-oxoacid CoA-transferase B subunit